MKVYIVEYENLSGLGGPMGSESTSESRIGTRSTVKKAKELAEKNFRKHGGEEKIKWTRRGKRRSSQDLRFCMYHIEEEEVQ